MHKASIRRWAQPDGHTLTETLKTRMKITFKLYATLQDLLPAGAVKNAVAIEVPDTVSLNQIIDQFKVPRELAHLVLVNGVFQCTEDRDAPGMLKEDDVLAIWPPVAGG